MKIPNKNCKAEICQICPKCDRRVNLLGEWFHIHGDQLGISVRLACPAGCVGTSFFNDLEQLLIAWCKICQKGR